MPIVPALAIVAGPGVAALVDAVASRRTRDAAAYATVGIAAAVMTELVHDARNRNTAEEWAFTGSSLITEHNLPDAEAAYRRALQLDPNSGLAWDGLGLAQYDAGRLADARRAFARAVALDNDNARALFHLALVDDGEGRRGVAIPEYERAAALSPDDADIIRHLATALGMEGRSREAMTDMQRVVELTPQDGEAWLDLALLSLDAGKPDAAANALVTARNLGANPQRLAFAEAALGRARSARD
jgi:superkiller protein 3